VTITARDLSQKEKKKKFDMRLFLRWGSWTGGEAAKVKRKREAIQ